ncbi:MAG: UDP-N-acetylmuramate dehydrogenase [Kofleriaceae bacterium]
MADLVRLIGDDEPGEAGPEAVAPSPPNPRSVLGADDRAALAALAVGELRFDEPLRRHTTLKLGGPADAWVAPSTIAGLAALLRACAARRLPVTVLGGGSNLLVRDGGVRGVVVSSRQLRGLSLTSPTTITVQAGVSTGKLLSLATRSALGGLEFLGGVPGSVGGGLIMNAGTYLGEFTQVTTAVRSLRLADGELVARDHAACGFRYRGSDLPPTEIVVEADLALAPRPQPEIEADVKALRQRRAEREPLRVSSHGSTFKNPPGDFAGRLIETAGCKGWREGDAVCSEVHANWLVNVGAATAADLERLIARVHARVREVHGVELELEVKRLGEP